MAVPSARPRSAGRWLIPAVAVALTVATAPASAVGGPGAVLDGARSPLSSHAPAVGGDKGEFYDARTDPGSQSVLRQKAAHLAARPRAGLQALRDSLGIQGVLDIDPLTGTPRQVSKLDGFLTPASKAAPEKIALGYLRTHAPAFGLTATDIAELSLRKAYVDIAGTTHLSYVQTVAGVPVFGNGVKAHVAKNGQLISIDGSPAAALPTGFAASKLTAASARAAAIANVDGTAGPTAVARSVGAAQKTTFDNADYAQQVVFLTVNGPRLAWQTIVAAKKGESYLHVLDAQTGHVLYRRSLVAHERAEAPAEATGRVFDYFPGALRGGDSHAATLPGLSKNATSLSGRYAHVYLDIDNDDAPGSGEEVGPSAANGSFDYPFTHFIKQVGAPCSSHYQCSWNPNVVGSWQTNKNQNAVQLYYYLATFHDHLDAAPIGFTRQAGNFDARDGDAVQAEAMDGANSDQGMPGDNANNANMSTPPDGFAPRMQMYLFYDDGSFEWTASNSGDAADIVYHEYTHGLSNRLVVDATGVSTLGNVQAGSMGEAWSDWYAMDFLVNEGYQSDRKNAADIRVGDYVGHGLDAIRTQPLDCQVGSTDLACPGTSGAGAGGYTYGDFGKIAGQPEVHADGEIWAETLWDLRCELGSSVTQSLVTRAMELSPGNPSFLDERNAILMADNAVFGGAHQQKIWSVFAKRGMGFFAAAIDGDDAAPAEDFNTPPPADTPTVAVSGKVTDAGSGAPIAGAVISFAGHPAAAGGSLHTTTDANGDYAFAGLVPGNYPKFTASGPGFERVSVTLAVTAAGATRDFALVRDWAAEAGGGEITAFNGEDYDMFGCGPRAMIDQSQGGGWSSDVVLTPTGIEARYLVLRLPVAVNVSDLRINPSNTCGDPGSSSTGAYRVETSVDGSTWVVAAEATFGVEHRNQMNSVALAAGSTTAVRFVRYTMLSSQAPECPGPYGGCAFVDSVELAVYGAAS